MNIDDRMRRRISLIILLLFVIILGFGGWSVLQSSGLSEKAIPPILANFTENGVEVTIRLDHDAQGQDILAAAFSALEPGFHVYSKDVPREGLKGLGRPTLVELTSSSKMQLAGDLLDSIAPLSESIQEDIPGLLVYPEGLVTLYLPVTLPEDAGEITDEVSVTYMACSQKGCKKPVEGKIIPVRYHTESQE